MGRLVSRVWHQIPPERRDTAVIFTTNYGQPAAIDTYGENAGLPGAYSGHMSYADWGPPPESRSGPTLLVGPTGAGGFTGRRQVAENENGVGLDNDEQGTRIWLCDAAIGPWSQIWPRLRHYY